VGITVDVLGIQPDEVEQLLNPLAAPTFGYGVGMDLERLSNDVPDRLARVQ
jgi:hypothetical protein